jgi:hypothetical protein
MLGDFVRVGEPTLVDCEGDAKLAQHKARPFDCLHHERMIAVRQLGNLIGVTRERICWGCD